MARLETKVRSGESRKYSHLLRTLSKAQDVFISELAELERACDVEGADFDALLKRFMSVRKRLFATLGEADRVLASDPEHYRRERVGLRERTNSFFQKSWLFNRARVWPQGYPGDYKIIKAVYRNTPLSEGIGYLLDRYFLVTTLAEAVRGRKAAMASLLGAQLRARKAPRVLNIGCGPCRELMDLAPEVHDSGAKVLCLDFDSDALDYSAQRLSHTPAAELVDFRKYNALRMVSAARNLKEFGPQDVIYSIGLLDYLEDHALIRLISALYDSLAPGGVFFAVFKDSERYETFDYHWLADWDAFKQRTADESREVIARAGIPEGAVRTERDRTGVIVFYTITRALP